MLTFLQESFRLLLEVRCLKSDLTMNASGLS